MGLQSLENRRVLANLLVAGIDSPPKSETNHAAISLIDLDARETSPVQPASLLQNHVPIIGPRLADEGIAGLAIDRDGQVFAAVRPAGPRSVFAPIGNGQSDLVIRDSATGRVTSRVPINLAGGPVEIADLTIDLATGELIGITSPRSPSLRDGFLVQINTADGSVTPIGDTGLRGGVAIALADDGTLYATSQTRNLDPLRLHTLDRITGAVLTTGEVVDTQSFGLTEGLAVEPGTGRLYGSETILGRIFTIDPDTLVRQLVDTQVPQRGVTGDLAFEPNRTADALSQLLHADFESGTDGFTFDNSPPVVGVGNTSPGLWHRSVGRRADGELNHSPDHSFYYGNFEGSQGGGHYITGTRHRGVLTSPEVAIPATGTSILSFSYLLDTRPDFDRDFATVSIDNGITDTVVLSRTAGTLPETIGDWLTATVDLADYAGQTIRVNYTFDTNDPVRIDPEGWYVDDVVIVHLAAPPIVQPPTDVDLSVVKTASAPSFRGGEEVTYTLTVTNVAAAPAAAASYTLTDGLPAGVTFVRASGSGRHADGVVTWDGGPLAPGQSASFTVTVLVNQPADDQIECGDVFINTVTVAAAEGVIDVNPDNDEFILDTPAACVDLVASKTANPTNTTVGQTFTFTLGVMNHSSETDTATGVTVRDTLPPGLTFDPLLSTPGAIFNAANRTVTWNAPDLPPGVNATYQLVAAVEGPVRFDPATLSNTVEVDSNEPDRNEPDNTVTIDVIIDPAPRRADILVTKTADKISVVKGERLTYTIVVTNQSAPEGVDPDSRTATSVTVVDTLPAGVTVVSVNRPADSETDRNDAIFPDTLTWQIPNLAVGESETFTVVVQVPVADDCVEGELTNSVTADLTGIVTDPLTTNNEATVTTTCIPSSEVDLAITKVALQTDPLVGDLLTYQITVTNAATGPRAATATGVIVRDILPPGVTFQQSSITPDAAGDYPLPNLAPGESQTFVISTIIDNDAGGTRIVNSAVVTFDGVDLNTINNMATTQTIPVQTVQFVNPTSVFRANNGVFAQSGQLPRATSPPTGQFISGYYFNDLNRDGQWDEPIETGAANVLVFIDADNDGVLDADLDPDDNVDDGEVFTRTDANGQYFLPVAGPGRYLVRAVLDDQFVLLRVPTFPQRGYEFLETPRLGSFNQPQLPLSVPFGNVVDVPSGSSVVGSSGVAMAPNFGGLVYSSLTRPADHFEQLTAQAADAITARPMEIERFRIVTNQFQKISYTNDGIGPVQIFSIAGDDSLTSRESSDYLSVYRINRSDGTLTEKFEPSSPINVDVGQSVDFFVFYDPAVRSSDPDEPEVLSQQPEWLPREGKPLDRSVHQFNGNQRLILQTRSMTSEPGDSITQYLIRLLGASTYDSDITGDGVVDALDLDQLQDLLKIGDGVLREDELLFDRTSDINARCPNGAEQVVGICRFNVSPGGGPNNPTNLLAEHPLREIGLGDYAPLAVEVDTRPPDSTAQSIRASRRPPVLDLDIDNSTVAGLDYRTFAQPLAGDLSEGFRVVDNDAFFQATGGTIVPQLTVELIGAQSGETLRYFDDQPADAGVTLLPRSENGSQRLVFINRTVDELHYAIRRIGLLPGAVASGQVRTATVRFTVNGLPGDPFVTSAIASTATIYLR